jgi:hypothetical protein
VQPGGFGANAELIGQVYVDRDLDGRFDEGRDTPVVRARVILAGGRQVLTDRFGRYHFANVPEQTATLRLDPNSVPYPALRVPQDRGLAGSRSVTVRGLTSVDFPLAPLGGDIAALRTTTVRAGPLTVLKTVMRDPATPDEYVVTLALDTTAALDAFVLSDPLPADAMMVTGQNVLETSLPIGTTILSYRFRFGGTERGAVTDPTVRWRYP